jgi:PD-(D/E)XK nuclease superfamily
MDLREDTYLSPEFSSLEELEKEVEFWDATTSQWLANCPRRGQYAIEEKAIPSVESPVLVAGKSLHGAMAVLYAGGEEDLALEELKRISGWDYDFRLPAGHKFQHLSLGHLEVIMKNYFVWRKKHDDFQVLQVSKDDMDLTDVLAASWLLTSDGKVVLGESKIVMRFMIDTKDGEVPFVYSGRPDLPVVLGGAINILDHKSTNAYLSDWYFNQYRFSNQLRGYGAMIRKLLHKEVSGCLINGIFMGEKASQHTFKGNRFSRFGPLTFMPAHFNEAIKNQYYWRKSLDFWRQQGYFPQHTSKLCQGCNYDSLCNSSPTVRKSILQREYSNTPTEFLDL